MSSDQPQEPQRRQPEQGWQPLPQGGDYDSEATAFVQLPDGMFDPSAMPPGSDPLAAPGQGYVPPPLAPGGPPSPPAESAAPRAHASADPAATGQWTMPFADPSPRRPLGMGPRRDPGPAPGRRDGGWGEAGTPGGDDGATGQWRIPPAADDSVDESGEYLMDGRTGTAGAGPYGNGAPLAGGEQWYAGEGTGSPAGTGAQWPGSRAGERLPDAPEASPNGGAARSPREQGDWRTTASAPTAPWPVPDADPPVADPSAAPRGGAGPRTDSRTDAPADDASRAWPRPSGESWQPAALDELPGHTHPGRTDDRPDADPTGDSRSLSGHAAEDAINRVTGAGPAAHDWAEATTDGTATGSAASTDTAHAAQADTDSGADATASGTRGAPAAEATGVQDHADEAAPQDAEATGPGSAEPHSEHPHASYVLTVNGADRPVTNAWIGESLLYVLRERLGLAGAKDGCSQGECGACSIQVDGRLVASCLVPAATTAGSEIRTVEGLAADGVPSDVQRALAAAGAVQCGFCVPGLAMTVHDLLKGNPAPTELETRQAICGNLCRCSGYRGVLDAVRQVVESRAESAEPESEAEPADTPRIPQQARPAEDSA
ncbi:2Fe-2S iron-sulfur cluster-binding protein [Streptomyces sp. KR80]|uniref:2Fe-2S iron-sulfur cluster-binding protein n=1 Tax=Streptomyces sp. KR80 TaxID=3457426 RepID=UPI003FD2C750